MNLLADLDLRVALAGIEVLARAAREALDDEREGDFTAHVEGVAVIADAARTVVRHW